MLILVLLVALVTIFNVCGLQEVRLVAPVWVRAGTPVTLLCLYDMQGAPLYSVKWYRGRHEFYRYMPMEIPHGVTFPFPGLQVDMAGSNKHQVTLRAVPHFLSGQFSCEVSEDAPSFSTACASANLSVIEMGVRRPSLTVALTVLAPGTALEANCSAQPTVPAPSIAFYVDDYKIDKKWVHSLGPGLASMSLTEMMPDLDNSRWVRCEASLAGAYRLTSTSIPVVVQSPIIGISASRTHSLKCDAPVIFLSLLSVWAVLI